MEQCGQQYIFMSRCAEDLIPNLRLSVECCDWSTSPRTPFSTYLHNYLAKRHFFESVQVVKSVEIRIELKNRNMSLRKSAADLGRLLRTPWLALKAYQPVST